MNKMDIKDLKKGLPQEDSWLEKRENGMVLSDHHIKVLNRNNIDYKKYKNIKELMFAINEMDIDEDDELEQVARDLDEMDYYSK